jgi:hypothetical protein
MKLIAIIVGAVLLTAAPFSLQCAPRKAGLYVDKADARGTAAARTTATTASRITALLILGTATRLLTTASYPTVSRLIPIPPIRRLEGSFSGLSDYSAPAIFNFVRHRTGTSYRSVRS